MPSIDDIYPTVSEYLKADDLKGPAQVRIEGVSTVEFDQRGKVERKLVLAFHGSEKTMVCNKTNALVLAEAFGKDYTRWVGERVTLFPAKVPFEGKLVNALRISAEKVRRDDDPSHDSSHEPDWDHDVPF